MQAKTNFSYTRGELVLMLKDIQNDFKHSVSHYPDGEFQRISFSHFKIKQTEIETKDDLLRI
jgi:hypothetical protein